MAISSSPALAVPHVDGSFKVGGNGASNLKLVAGLEGNIWVTNPSGAAKNLIRITPAGEVKEYELSEVVAPTGIAVGPEGSLWLTEEKHVDKFSPSNPEGTVDRTEIPGIDSNASIVAGPDGQMWVATANAVIHFPPSNPAGFKSIEVAELSPHDIDVAGSLLVIADSNHSRIVTLTTSGTRKDFPMLGTINTSQGVAGNPNGQFAFSSSEAPEGLGLVTPPGAPTTLEMLGDPFGVALGSDGAYWFAMFAAENVERLTPDGHATPLNGFPKELHPRQITAGPDNTLWVAMEKPGEFVEVARVSGLEPPVKPGPGGGGPKPAPETKITKGPKGKVKTRHKRAKVKFAFSSTTAGATFECALARVKSKKGKKAKKSAPPRFSACKSPKTYQLKPGKYTFAVRAVLAGVADPSPARSNFRVVHVGG
jgi:streptogramin lyase